LGSLDAPLPSPFYPVLWAGLALCALTSVVLPRDLGRDLVVRTLLLASALASTLLIFLALLITWTPHPAVVVNGVQGRYFVVPALLAAYALSGSAHTGSGPRRLLSQTTAALFVGISVTALLATLITRYH
jgi:uncharacterized membrane protein